MLVGSGGTQLGRTECGYEQGRSYTCVRLSKDKHKYEKQEQKEKSMVTPFRRGLWTHGFSCHFVSSAALHTSHPRPVLAPSKSSGLQTRPREGVEVTLHSVSIKALALSVMRRPVMKLFSSAGFVLGFRCNKEVVN